MPKTKKADLTPIQQKAWVDLAKKKWRKVAPDYILASDNGVVDEVSARQDTADLLYGETIDGTGWSDLPYDQRDAIMALAIQGNQYM